MTGECTTPFKAGAYAALQSHPRKSPNTDGGTPEWPAPYVRAWYAGFDEARRRLAALEGELVRGEERA